MKKEGLIALVAIVALVAGYVLGSLIPVTKFTSPKMSSELDTFAYGTGLDLGFGLNEYIEQFDLEDDFPTGNFIKGFNDGLDSNLNVFSRMEAQMAIQNFVMKQSQAKQEKSQLEAEDNLAKGQSFLEENAKKEGIIVTGSGLQYEILQEGSGESPSDTDTVVVHYHGTLIDGTVFDSSVDRGEPATFAVNRVIEGWTEGLQLMKPGAKYTFYIPSELAYGPQQRSEVIKANSALIFEVELIEVKGKN